MNVKSYSIKSFNTTKKVKFSTWLANQAKYHCLNTLNKKSKDRLVSTGDEILDYLKEIDDNTCFENLFEFIETSLGYFSGNLKSSILQAFILILIFLLSI